MTAARTRIAAIALGVTTLLAACGGSDEPTAEAVAMRDAVDQLAARIGPEAATAQDITQPCGPGDEGRSQRFYAVRVPLAEGVTLRIERDGDLAQTYRASGWQVSDGQSGMDEKGWARYDTDGFSIAATVHDTYTEVSGSTDCS